MRIVRIGIVGLFIGLVVGVSIYLWAPWSNSKPSRDQPVAEVLGEVIHQSDFAGSDTAVDVRKQSHRLGKIILERLRKDYRRRHDRRVREDSLRHYYERRYGRFPDTPSTYAELDQQGRERIREELKIRRFEYHYARKHEISDRHRLYRHFLNRTRSDGNWKILDERYKNAVEQYVRELPSTPQWLMDPAPEPPGNGPPGP